MVAIAATPANDTVSVLSHATVIGNRSPAPSIHAILTTPITPTSRRAAGKDDGTARITVGECKKVGVTPEP